MDMEHVAPERRGNDFAAIQAVAVGLSQRGPASMERRAHLFGGPDANRVGQKRI